MDNQKQIDAILKQEIDIGFVRYDRLPKHIKKKPIYEDTFSIVLPASHPMTQRKFVPTSLKHGYDRAIKFIELKKIVQRTTLQVIWNRNNKSQLLDNVLAIIRK